MPSAVVDTTFVTEDATTASPSQRMRRVASAPAFKHMGGYQAPSAAAAVAQAQADAAAEAAANAVSTSDASSSNSSTLQPAPKRRLFTWGASSSSASQQRQHAASSNTPSSCSSCCVGRCNCLEVYVVSRAFTEFGGELLKKLPADAKEHMVDMGICHYMTVFKTPDGKLVQFDFGPLGGDVQVSHGPLKAFLQRAHAAALAQAQAGQAGLQLAEAGAAAEAGGAAGSSSVRGMVHSPSAPVLPLASLDLAGEAGEAASAAMQGQAPAQRRKKGVAGEIREKELEALPPASMYMGRTQLSLADIREYNNAQGNLRYTLHDYDCRHYVNSLVQYATGVERSTQHLKRHYFHTRNKDKFLWYGWFISATQFVTDVGNWSHIQAGAAATLIAVTGRSTLAQLKTLALPVMPALTKTLPSLIPSAAGAGGAAAGAGAGAGSVAGGLVTTLKLPAALLLKRPIAGSVAAAGGAGAAAAAIRTVPGNADGAAAAAAGSGSSNRGFGGFGGWSRPLLQWKDGLGLGLKGAMLSLRRAAVGNREAMEQLHPAAAAAAAAPGLSTAATRGWFGRARANRQLAAAGTGAGSGMAVAAAAAPVGAAVMALPSPGTPRARWGGRGSYSSGRSSGSGDGSGAEDVNNMVPERRQQRGPGIVTGLGHHVGRHVMWLGSTAAKATGTIAVLASKQVGYLVGGARGSPGAAAAALGGGPVGMSHSTSTANLLLHQQQQQHQQQRSLMGHRSRSAPSLAMVAAAAAAGLPGQAGAAGGSAAPAASEDLFVASAVLDDPVFGGGSSSVTCSSVGGRSSGVGRQVLNLPLPPRISWGKRASHAMIFGQ